MALMPNVIETEHHIYIYIYLPGVLKKGSLKGALKLFLLENFFN